MRKYLICRCYMGQCRHPSHVRLRGAPSWLTAGGLALISLSNLVAVRSVGSVGQPAAMDRPSDMHSSLSFLSRLSRLRRFHSPRSSWESRSDSRPPSVWHGVLADATNTCDPGSTNRRHLHPMRPTVRVATRCWWQTVSASPRIRPAVGMP